MHNAPWMKTSSSMSGHSVLPEFHAPVVGGVCLYGQVDRHLRPFFAHGHNQTRIRHNQRVGFHGNQRLHVGDEGFELGIVRQGVDGQKEFFVALVRFFNALLEDVEFGKFVVAGAQGVTRAAGINGVCAVVVGGAHTFEAAGGKEEFGCFHVRAL